jgi:hypothetical protein
MSNHRKGKPVQVQVLVTVDAAQIAPDDDKGATGEFQVAAVEAVKNAVSFGEQNGFCHALAEVVSIGVVSIELAESRSLKAARNYV